MWTKPHIRFKMHLYEFNFLWSTFSHLKDFSAKTCHKKKIITDLYHSLWYSILKFMIILSFACWVVLDGAQPGVVWWWLCSSINPPHGGRRVTVLRSSRCVSHKTWKYTVTSSSEASRSRVKLQFKRTHPWLPLLSISLSHSPSLFVLRGGFGFGRTAPH